MSACEAGNFNTSNFIEVKYYNVFTHILMDVIKSGASVEHLPMPFYCSLFPF